MGNGLARISPNQLPTPVDDDLRTFLIAQGVIFHEMIDSCMSKVNIPERWGIFCDFDRGDIWTGYLLNGEGQQMASINWMSKGSYDNEANMHLIIDQSKTINPLMTEFSNGVYTLCKNTESKFVNELNMYYEQQHRGKSQKQLDEIYDGIIVMKSCDSCDFYDSYDFHKLLELTPEQKISSLLINFSKPFTCKNTQSLWI